jgi:putative PIN family toxin of toxin-antitoxin system
LIVTFDSGIYISAIQFGGVPGRAISKALLVDKIVFCDNISDEVIRVMRDKFAIAVEETGLVLRSIWLDAEHLEILGTIIGVCRDAKDDFILECAILGHADLIVTGDRDLLSLGNYEGVRIITPRAYLDETMQQKL